VWFEILAKSLTMREKLALRMKLRVGNLERDLVNEWKEVLGTTNPKFYTTRLQWSNYDGNTVKYLCSEVYFKKSCQNTLTYFVFLEALVKYVNKFDREKLNYKNKDIPFYDVLEVIAIFCVSRINLESVSIVLCKWTFTRLSFLRI